MQINHQTLRLIVLPFAITFFVNCTLAATPLTPPQTAQVQATQKATATTTTQKVTATANITSIATSKAVTNSKLTSQTRVAPSSAKPLNIKSTTTKITESKSLNLKHNLSTGNGVREKSGADAGGPTDTNNYLSTSPTGQ